MKTIPVPMTTVDMETGEVTAQETVQFGLLPPDNPDVCQTCNVEHDPALPHNNGSLYYQYSFFSEHGRFPTWHDAMAHCTQEMKDLWIEELSGRGVAL